MRFVFLLNGGEQMMALLVDNHRRVVGGGRSKNVPSVFFLSRHKLSNLEIAGFSS